jgi:uncharacterized membrane protein
MTAFFANIGYLLTGLFIVTAIWCVASRSVDAFASGVILGMICLTAWIPELWDSPLNMSVAHLGILISMLVGLKGRWAKAMILAMFIAIICDALWMVMPLWNLPENALHFPYSIFWWQSVLNILFIFQCVFTMARCYNSHRTKGQHRDTFYARHIEGHNWEPSKR